MEEIKNKKYGFIYVTTNNVNNMKYIGQKKYSMKNWKTYLGSGIHLKRAIQKYGKDNFTREIIEECYSKQELDEREKYWIKYYNADKDKNFYNIAQGGDGGFVVSGYSDKEYEIYEHNRIKKINENRPYGENCGSSKLTEKNVNDIIIRLLNNDTTTEIAKDYGVAIETIRDILNHKTWRKLTDGIEFPKPSGHLRINVKGKPVMMYDLNGNLIETFVNARDCERKTGIGYKLISRVCNGQRQHTHGYVFRFCDNNGIDAIYHVELK